MSVPAASPSCDYCGLPILGSQLPDSGSPRTTAGNRGGVAPADDKQVSLEPLSPKQYCCFGCRFAAQIAASGGQTGQTRWALIRLGLAIFFAMQVMAFSMALWSTDIYADQAPSGEFSAGVAGLFRYLCFLLSLPVVLLLSGPLVDNLKQQWQRRRINTDGLVALGVAASYAYSVVCFLYGQGHLYFEVGCSILVAMMLGRWLEATCKAKTADALASLQRLLPEECLVSRGGQESSAPLNSIQLGETIHVRSGERVGLDGQVTAGLAEVDEQLLSGESVPVFKAPGSDVWAGSVVTDGDLYLRVAAIAGEGTLGKLADAVRTAAFKQDKYQRLADRISGAFTPLVIVVALASAVAHGLAKDPFSGLLVGLSVLLIACPCSLGLATPLAIWSALSTAARTGTFFKDGDALIQLAAIRGWCFDKTGTLTTGQPNVLHCHYAENTTAHDLAQTAGPLLLASRHIFARAIAAHLGLTHARVDGQTVEHLPGRGVFKQIAPGKEVAVGSIRFLEDRGYAISTALRRWQKETDPQPETKDLSAQSDAQLAPQTVPPLPSCAIGWDGQFQAVFEFEETLRPEVAPLLAWCAQSQHHALVLTGDDPRRAYEIERQLGVPVTAGLLPEQKLEQLRALRTIAGPVAMVGDGVNDSPALAGADLGIAMGCGADVSRQAAQMCLLGNDLSRLPRTHELANQTVRVIRQNLCWSFAYNGLGIALAAAGWLNPVFAAAAMLASSLFVITNSLRLSRPGSLASSLTADQEVGSADVFGEEPEPARPDHLTGLSHQGAAP